MDRTAVDSSWVASVGYEPDTMTLEVKLKSGAIYRYLEVPESAYQELIAAGSIGAYLNQNIKGSYRWVQTGYQTSPTS